MTTSSPVAVAQQTFESHFFESDGVRLHYIDVGHGELVLLIQGLAVNLEPNYVRPASRPSRAWSVR